MLASGKRALQASNGWRLCTHSFGNLRLGQPGLLARFQKSIEQYSFFSLDAVNLGTNARPLQELLDDLIMGSHV